MKLQVTDLEMDLGGKKVLQKVSFGVKTGEFLSVLGPSGCGKTTLLRILMGLQTPTAGRICKDGMDITHLPPAARGMGIVFQNYALFEPMTVLGNVEYALRIRKENKGSAGRSRVRKQAEEMLAQVGLLAHAGKYPHQLSGGQQQRVAIARTMVLQPDIILFDEPMSALDAETRLTLREELLRLRRAFGTTMLYITHDQEEAFSMSDRIMVMQEGRVVQLDTPGNILRHPADDYVKTFVLQNLERKLHALMHCVRDVP